MIRVIPYSDSLKNDFYLINKEWISSMFAMEEIDEKILTSPQEMIINLGGFIWFAENEDRQILGTCALRKTGENQFELIKMGVYEKARGLNVGDILLKHVIKFIKTNPNNICYLLTNAKCEAAIHLYLKNGFVHDREILTQFGPEYSRCNVAMRLT
jgi:GNAT superfamily N-acetyltransferase